MADEKKVVVYSSSTCPWCTTTKDYLKEHNIDFVEKNITTDTDARNELIAMGHMGVPVIVIDGEEIVGFDQARIDVCLGL